MTRPFEQQVMCPFCKKWHSAESALERWIRNNPDLDSLNQGLVRFDCDILLHKYLTFTDKKGTRKIQNMMFIEAKANKADLNESQRDTLSCLSQILRNRRKNIYQNKLGTHALDHVPPIKVYSRWINDYVSIRLFGGHLLQLEKNDPFDSSWMKWDWKHQITPEQLVKLLRFEIDPDSLREIDWRRRSSSFELPLFKKSA